MPCHW